ncbi:MAG: hypothetical protein OEM49_10035 [Myxococcales bacterium]|nr:hypothetical protein [Myxococcales bacterium]MDH5566208.1 hypothetical protein [Myxococcales bacterium]
MPHVGAGLSVCDVARLRGADRRRKGERRARPSRAWAAEVLDSISA